MHREIPGWTGQKIRHVRTTLLIAAGAIAAVALGLLPLNLALFKGLAEELFESATGLELHLSGPVRLRLGPAPQLTAVNIRIHSNDKSLAQLENIQIQASLVDFLRGHISFKRINAAELQLNTCTELPATSSNNAPASGEAPGKLPSIIITRLQISRIQVNCDEQVIASLQQLTLTNNTDPTDPKLTLNATGTLNELPAELDISASDINSLLDQQRIDQLDTRLLLQDSELSFTGQATLDSPGLSGAITLNLRPETLLPPDVGSGLPLPQNISITSLISIDTQSAEITDTVAKADGQSLKVHALSLEFADRPALKGSLSAQRIVLGRWLSPETPADTGIAKAPPADTADSKIGDLFLTLISTAKKWDIDVQALVNEVRLNEQAVQNFSIGLKLAEGDGEARLGMQLGAANVDANILLNANQTCPAVSANAEINNLALDDLAELAASADISMPDDIGGQLSRGDLNISSCGNNTTELTQNVNFRLTADGNLYSQNYAGVTAELSRAKLSGGFDEPVSGLIKGTVESLPVEGNVQFGSGLSDLLNGRFQINLNAGETRFRTEGAIDAETGIAATIELSSPDISELHALTGGNPDAQAPLSFKTDLSIIDTVVRADKFSMSLGNSNLNGALSWDEKHPQTAFNIQLHSRLIDAEELLQIFPDDNETNPQADTSPPPKTRSIKAGRDTGIPPGVVDIRIDNITGTPVEISNITLGGRLVDRSIDDAKLSLDLEGTTYRGLFDGTFAPGNIRVSTDISAANIKIGQLLKTLHISDTIDADADNAVLRFQAEADDLQSLPGNLDINAEVTGLNLNIEDAERTIDLQFSELYLRNDNSQGSRWSASGSFNGVPLESRLNAPSLKVLLSETKVLSIDSINKAGRDVMAFSANIDRSRTERTTGDFSISAGRIDDETTRIDAIKLPLTNFQLNTAFDVNRKRIAFDNIQAATPNSLMKGDAQLLLFEDHRELNLKLAADSIEIRDFAGLLSEYVDAPDVSEVADAEVVPVLADTEADKGLLAATDAAISSFLRENWLNIQLDVNKLSSDGNELGRGRLTLISDRDRTEINPLRIESGDGSINASILVKDDTDGRSLDIKADAANFEIGGLVPLVFPELPAYGSKLYVDTEITTTQPAQGAVTAELEGYLDIGIAPKGIPAGVLDLWAGNLLFAMLPTPEKGESRKQLNCLVASFDIEEGDMKTKNVLLDSTDVIVRARGNINLPEQNIDLVMVPQSKVEKFFSVSAPVRISGPWDDFEVGVEGAGIVGTLFRWYISLIYVPFKWLTGERFPKDGIATCLKALDIDPEQAVPETN